MERLHTLGPDGRRTAARVRRARAARGFTLIELTVVVIIVGVFAAMAIPQVTLQMRDRRVREIAQRAAIVYQQARMRALGQGGAVMVRYTGTGQGSFETLEALVGTADAKEKCQDMPAVSCTKTDWNDATNAAKQYHSLETIDLSKEPRLADVATRVTTDAGVPGTAMDVCFTPVGRTFMRFAKTDAWATPQGVPVIEFARTADGFTTVEGLARKVLVLPTGIARLQL